MCEPTKNQINWRNIHLKGLELTTALKFTFDSATQLTTNMIVLLSSEIYICFQVHLKDLEDSFELGYLGKAGNS